MTDMSVIFGPRSIASLDDLSRVRKLLPKLQRSLEDLKFATYDDLLKGDLDSSPLDDYEWSKTITLTEPHEKTKLGICIGRVFGVFFLLISLLIAAVIAETTYMAITDPYCVNATGCPTFNGDNTIASWAAIIFFMIIILAMFALFAYWGISGKYPQKKKFHRLKLSSELKRTYRQAKEKYQEVTREANSRRRLKERALKLGIIDPRLFDNEERISSLNERRKSLLDRQQTYTLMIAQKRSRGVNTSYQESVLLEIQSNLRIVDHALSREASTRVPDWTYIRENVSVDNKGLLPNGQRYAEAAVPFRS